MCRAIILGCVSLEIVRNYQELPLLTHPTALLEAIILGCVSLEIVRNYQELPLLIASARIPWIGWRKIICNAVTKCT
ncbi:MAG: hypothetical protein EAZ69_19170 [Oscillatoriales cyanobacterium]|nr:MAG: hypothetical protein EAZ69_19170 [Oscillatoriales cyanobacterium]